MIKIEFSGSGDEVRNEMLKLLGLHGLMNKAETPERQEKEKRTETEPPMSKAKGRGVRRGRKAAAPPRIGWTEKDAEKLLDEIKPNAKKILAEIATKPEGYRRSELVQVLGSSEQSLRGQLSSVGAALKRIGKKTSPLSHETVDKEFYYKLDADFAGIAKNYPV
jgi:hypothetical protein